MGKGSNTTSTTSSSSADPQAAALYRSLLTRAEGVASTPYQAYSGDLTAPINAQQQQGIAGINSNAGYASPFMQQASQQAGASTAPITASTIQGYQNPYTQQVVDATTSQMAHDNATQQAGLTGNQIAQGALGGNATGVARGVLAGQQGRTMASTVAGLYDQSYKQALGAAQQQQQVGLAGANAQANYGISGQNAALTGATAQIGAGSLQQATSQADLDRQYQQYAQAQAYPYQQAQWLAGVGTGVGSNLGGTSQGTSTAPAPNQTAQWVGAGLTAASMLSDREAKEDIERIGKMNDGTPIYRFRYKGSPQWHVGPMAQDVEKRNPDAVSRGVDGYRYVDMHEASEDSVERASGGGVSSPWADIGKGWIPTIGISGGSGAPRGGSPSGQPQGSSFDPSKMASGLSGAAKGMGGLDWGGLMSGSMSGDAWGGGSFFGGDAYGGSSTSPLAGLDASDYGAGFANGGGVAGYAGGGAPRLDFTDTGEPENFAGRFAPAEERPFGLAPSPQPTQDDVINPDEPYRMPDAKSVEEWRAAPLMPHAAAGAEDDDEAPMPTGVAGRTGGAGAGPVMAFGPESGANSYAALPDAIRRPGVAPQGAGRPEDERGGLGLLPLSRNATHGLMTAGLGMMASRSPFLGNAIGEGGMTGLAAYGQAEEHDRKVASEAQKLAQESREKSQNFGLNVRKQNESERHNRASESTAQKSLDRTKFIPAGSIMGADGIIQPAVMEQSTGKIINAVTGQAPGATDKIIPKGEGASGKLPALFQRNKDGGIELSPGAEEASAKLAAARKGPQGELMDDETAKFMADRIIAGDTKVLTGLGRGQQGAANILKVQTLVAKRAASGEPISEAAREILNNAAQFEGLKTAERTQAGIMAKLSVYGRTAFNATDIALDLSKEVPRTSYQPVNKIINAAKTKTGDPKIVALGQALMTLTNEYARAIGGGHGTVHDKEAAEKRLSEAQSHEQLEAVIKVMRREILAEEKAMPAARQHIRDIYNPKPGGGVKSIAGEHGAAQPPGPVSGASGFSPPPGAIPRQYQGKTYYYDPTTKQPYPGQ